MTDINTLIGKGLTFPLQLQGGRLVVSTGVELLRSAIGMRISWPAFTKFYDYNFGCRIPEIIADPSDAYLKQLASYFVIKALEKEYRIKLKSIKFTTPLDNILLLQLQYTIVSTNQEDLFTFPFYKP
jgi:phage baseplate assembly protein W